MFHPATPMAITVFWLLVGAGVVAAFYLARRTPPTTPPHAPWFLPGLARGTELLSGAMLLGTCGLIAFYGYDGFLYAIGFVAGAFAALLVVAPPLAQFGPTLPQALYARFPTPAVYSAAAAATLIISLLLLTAEILAAGALLTPMLGTPVTSALRSPPLVAGAIALLLALLLNNTPAQPNARLVAAVQGILMLLACGTLTSALLHRGLTANSDAASPLPRILSTAEFRAQLAPTDTLLPNTGPWADRCFARVRHQDGSLTLWHFVYMQRLALAWNAAVFTECQLLTLTPEGRRLVNNLPPDPAHELRPAGFIARLPQALPALHPAGPLAYLAALQESNLAEPHADTVVDDTGTHTIYYPRVVYGGDFLLPGRMPGLFPNLGTGGWWDRLNFISLMLALACGSALLPALSPRQTLPARSAGNAVAMAVIASIFLLTLFLGLGALASGCLDPADSNRTFPLLAGSFGQPALVLVCALGLALLIGMLRRLMAAATSALGVLLPARAGTSPSPSRSATIIVIAVLVLAALLHEFNAAFLVGWACNIAASAFLPALAMLLFSKNTKSRVLAPSILVGLITSTAWIALTPDAFQYLYGIPPVDAARLSPLPFNQPALVTIPLAFITLLVGNLLRHQPQTTNP